jgi:hypothetical protein
MPITRDEWINRCANILEQNGDMDRESALTQAQILFEQDTGEFGRGPETAAEDYVIEHEDDEEDDDEQ